MKKRLIFILVLICVLSSACGKQSQQKEPGTLGQEEPLVEKAENEDTSEKLDDGRIHYDLLNLRDEMTPLENPDKGWYIHYYDNDLHRYGTGLNPADIKSRFPCLDHVYLRLAWSYLEESEGRFNWTLIDDQIKQWSAVGVRVAIRVTCMESGGYDERQYFATPQWVMEAGAQGRHGEQGWEPDFDDPVFLRKLENFHKAFAARYDGNPNIVYVDIGSLGVWGEGHTIHSSYTLWEFETVRKHCDIYLKYYKKTQLAATDEFVGYIRDYTNQQTMLNYLKDNGVTLRDDSIGVKEQASLYKNSVESPEYFAAVKDTRPVILECEHFHTMLQNGTWKWGRYLEGAIKTCGATYAGFHGYADSFLNENLGVAGKLANQMGYWFFVDELSTSEQAGKLNINLKICNRGAAVAYNKYKLMLYLTDASGNRTEYLVDAFDSTTATPDVVKDYAVDVDLSGLAAGTYTVGIRMSDDTGRPIYLALKGGDDSGYYELAKIVVGQNGE